ncbi:UPF0565 protein C2orf69 homolog [Clonorchis sinensis]|uniref:UPF0565 protein C2orf69 homolog n=1 Tax=Clonorchis sinensis TaxID=79923 RepID=H2KRB5_CLOSI|nr:UPF0565 protein C2orf69 homolog [Clonorchis sinensis]
MNDVTIGVRWNIKLSMPSDRLITMLLLNCTGYGGLRNDVLFFGRPGPASSNVVYIGGDIQDTECNMQSHPEKRGFVKWSLEATGRLLVERYALQGRNVHLWMIRPCQWVSNVFASYRNFVSVDPNGNPILSDSIPTNSDLVEHLSSLIEDAAMKVRKHKPEIATGFEGIPVTVIGFSKGCCVLTGLLYILSACKPYTLRESGLLVPSDGAKRFLSNIRALYWLDAGHSAVEHQWPTSEANLSVLRRTACPELHAYATPYQVEDKLRPWKARDYHTFIGLLAKYALPHKHAVLFKDEQTKRKEQLPDTADIQTHFTVLKHFLL